MYSFTPYNNVHISSFTKGQNCQNESICQAIHEKYGWFGRGLGLLPAGIAYYEVHLPTVTPPLIRPFVNGQRWEK